ncbi:hypothetical protein C9374_001753 [Naegleria lovaniensis]|uniref:Uncharacterized protein n=1 Tax=Naegleria lovaniensis TaxID=51637 RepID=A0AA88GS75_NAELO|nr:uncharacterized protein C9374_001753 [Naegleria lovaniensis]KAG2387421.1 hypothetical protein C9374_001753 [Naegleria lovaniensis]
MRQQLVSLRAVTPKHHKECSKEIRKLDKNMDVQNFCQNFHKFKFIIVVYLHSDHLLNFEMMKKLKLKLENEQRERKVDPIEYEFMMGVKNSVLQKSVDLLLEQQNPINDTELGIMDTESLRQLKSYFVGQVGLIFTNDVNNILHELQQLLAPEKPLQDENVVTPSNSVTTSHNEQIVYLPVASGKALLPYRYNSTNESFQLNGQLWHSISTVAIPVIQHSSSTCSNDIKLRHGKDNLQQYKCKPAKLKRHDNEQTDLHNDRTELEFLIFNKIGKCITKQTIAITEN